MNKIMIRILLMLLMVGILCLYVYDLAVNHTKPTEHLFRTLSVVFICLAGISRTFGKRNRKKLDVYDDQFSDVLQGAFSDQPFWRKKLLCAVRLFDEGNYHKAIKYLTDLKDKCRYQQDYYAVFLFAGRSFTEMGMYEHAQSAYQALINAEIANSRIFSNLGHVQIEIGECQKALKNYETALEYDRDNPYAYNNLAGAYFRLFEFEKATEYALKALQIKPQMYQAAGLLAVIYSLNEDMENAEKYSHIAISNGKDPSELKEAIEHYRSVRKELIENLREIDEEHEIE